MKEIIIKVNGMVCGGCENRVKNVIKTLEGIENVEVDHTTGVVKVLVKEEVSQKEIEQKIEDIGFEVE